ncbi:MFS transporter [Sphingomonas pokkalii]|uniref:MFS transporter n=1 Tax=Sphingomonas pokkalii TaxID=2175090 RepID=A0A2U0SJQ4_9SPHN|nr:MFS transporter [Sphingomonas pokkalii]
MLGVTCGASPLPFNVLPLMIGPIHADLGWSFALISAGVTVLGVIGALMAPLFGAAADHIGVRRVALWSLAAFGIGFGAFYFLPANPAGYIACWAALGLIAIGSSPVTWSRAISMWFDRRRGLALAIMLMGTSLSALIVPQIAQRAIEAGGWRAGFPALAVLPLLVALPVALLWFREPRPEERPPGVTDASGALWGLTLGQAVRSYRFWVLITSILLIAFAYGGAHIHMVQIVAMHGVTPKVAAGVMGLVAIGILSGRLIVGFLFDRLWAPGVAFPALLLPAFACLLLMGTGTSLTWLMLAGYLLGVAAGTEADVIAFLAAKYFGMAHFGRIYGMLYMPFGVGSAISPILYGAVRDATGRYDAMLMAAMLLFATGGALLLTLGRYPRSAEQGVS